MYIISGNSDIKKFSTKKPLWSWIKYMDDSFPELNSSTAGLWAGTHEEGAGKPYSCTAHSLEAALRRRHWKPSRRLPDERRQTPELWGAKAASTCEAHYWVWKHTHTNTQRWGGTGDRKGRELLRDAKGSLPVFDEAWISKCVTLEVEKVASESGTKWRSQRLEVVCTPNSQVKSPWNTQDTG